MLSIFFIILFCVAPSFATNAHHQIDEKQQLQKIVNTAIEKYHLPSLTISYKLPHQEIQTLYAGYANLKPLRKIKSNALYGVGSITKSFTSVIILRLQQAGKLNIHDTLSEFSYPHTQLKKWLDAYPPFRHVTIREILNHSSGVPAALNTPLYTKLISKNPALCYSPNYLMKHIVFKQKPYFKPGTGYHYTNTDYYLAMALIEAVTKHTYQSQISQIFHDVDFKSNSFFMPTGCAAAPAWLKEKMPHGYMPSNSGWPKLEMEALAKYPHAKSPGSDLILYDVTTPSYVTAETAFPAGGLITNTQNLIKWYNLLFEKRFLNKKSMHDFLNGIKTPFSYKYGLGITIRYSNLFKTLTYSHDGSLPGYRANDIFLKKYKIILALTTNASNGAVELNSPLVNHILKILIQMENVKKLNKIHNRVR